MQPDAPSSDGTTCAKRLGECSLVEIVELAADRHSVRELGDADREALDTFGDEMRRGLTLKGRVHGQHDLIDPPALDTSNKKVDREIFRADALQC